MDIEKLVERGARIIALHDVRRQMVDAAKIEELRGLLAKAAESRMPEIMDERERVFRRELRKHAPALLDLASRALSERGEERERLYSLGQRVRKTKGASWQGAVVGFYSTALTPVGYAVESEREPGSVQIYPESALEIVPPASTRTGGDNNG